MRIFDLKDGNGRIWVVQERDTPEVAEVWFDGIRWDVELHPVGCANGELRWGFTEWAMWPRDKPFPFKFSRSVIVVVDETGRVIGHDSHLHRALAYAAASKWLPVPSR